MSPPRIVAIVGPTAAGKTAAAVALAERFGGELVGSDSVQVYRGFDIGSGKARPEELRGIPHHLIDVLEPGDKLDAAQFAALADRAIEAIAARGKVPIVVGGTPLWMRALLRGLVDLPPSDAALRRDLQERMKKLGTRALHAELREIDPAAAERIHPNDAIRIARALEIHAQTGRPPSALWAEHRLGAPRYPQWIAWVHRERAELERAIEERLDAMLARGFVDEVRALMAATQGVDAPAMRSVGYLQFTRHVMGELSREEARSETIFATRHYAKQQRNWWKSDPSVTARTTSDALVRGEHDAAIRAFLHGRSTAP